jgi:DNA-binding response OmpR family regulator
MQQLLLTDEETMNTLQEEVTKHIKKLVRPLKEEEELKAALKVKLTKKEFKLLTALAQEQDLTPLKEKLNLDEARYEELSTKLTKKLNQEKIKQALCL